MKLKPVTFVRGRYNYHNQNTTQQILLLNALKVTQDPKKLKEMIGVKTVAEVFRTLDKMAIRKEYHKALSERGISFEYLLDSIKDIIDNGEKDSDRLNAVKTLLKSVGVDKYEDQNISGGSWEDILINMHEKEKLGAPKPEILNTEYNVDVPKIPDSVKKKKEDNDDGKSIYE